MEVCRGLRGPELDVILHGPGGSAEATASIVRYLRRKFTDIRVFVPMAAMSAATMWSLAGNEIHMGKHSQLGPIDPQLVTQQGQIPARAIIEQFERAKREVGSDPSLLAPWLPILQQYGPALLEQCEKAEQLARRLVREWLEKYMFAGKRYASSRAEKVAAYFANYTLHQSHSLGIDRDQARAEGVVIRDLERDQTLQDLVLSVHHATMHTFGGAGDQDRRESPGTRLRADPADPPNAGPCTRAGTGALHSCADSLTPRVSGSREGTSCLGGWVARSAPSRIQLTLGAARPSDQNPSRCQRRPHRLDRNLSLGGSRPELLSPIRQEFANGPQCQARGMPGHQSLIR